VPVPGRHAELILPDYYRDMDPKNLIEISNRLQA
jgi:hypothetical protein